jgi:glycosyltransferase involved in cell wall biosynthesis
VGKIQEASHRSDRAFRNNEVLLNSNKKSSDSLPWHELPQTGSVAKGEVMIKKKILYVISDIDKALAFEWMTTGLKDKYNLCFVLIGKSGSKFSAFLQLNSISFYEISDNQFSSTIRKWIRLLSVVKREKPEIVHTHLWRANLLGLTVSWILSIKKRIYTRHHATVHYHEYPSGRKWDRLCNVLATDIVAISENTKNILVDWDKADAQKITVIHHGFDFDYFNSVSQERIDRLKDKWNIEPNDFPVVGVISRYLKLKGLQYIIPAFEKVKKQYPTAKLVLANAKGNYERQIKTLLQTLPLGSYVEIDFEEDLAALYRLFDVFVHVPIDPNIEAFGQTYIESLLVQVPSIFTLSGVAREFVKHEYNAWVVDFEKSDQIAEGILKLLVDKNLSKQLRANGQISIQQFSIGQHILGLEKLYTR